MVKIGKKPYLLFNTLGLLLIAISAWAEVGVVATVDRNQIGVGDTLTLTISVNADESLAVGDQRLPELDGFDLIQQFSGRESRSVFTGGKFQFLQTQKFNYVLQANKEGKLVIPPVEVVANNKSYKTNPITITVTGQGQGRQAPGALPGMPQQRHRPKAGIDDEAEDPFDSMMDEADEMFNQLLQRRGGGIPGGGGGPHAAPSNPDDAFSIQLEVDKNEAFVGEQVTASWYLYTRNQIQNIDTLKYPNLKAFWKEDIEIATRLNFQQEVVNGIPYKRALLVSYALFPIKEGQGLIDSYKARCSVLMGGLGAFGMGNVYNFTKASQEMKIRIKPLPTHGRPADFSGGVGDFQVRYQLDSKTVPAHQPFSFKIRFEGRGNAKTIELPPLELPKGLELYDTKAESKFNRDGTSYKEFELLLIPRQEGKITIPAISVSLFDPKKVEYVQRSTPPIEISVVAGRVNGAATTDIPQSPSNASAPKNLGPELILEWGDSPKLSKPAEVAIWGLFFVLITAAVGWKGYRELSSSEKKRSLIDRTHRRLKVAHDLFEKSEWRKGAAEVTNTVYLVLGELAGEGGANTELEKLWPKLPPSIKQELGQELQKLVRDFEVIGFAPEEVVGRLKEKSEQLTRLDQLEKILSRAIRMSSAEGEFQPAKV